MKKHILTIVPFFIFFTTVFSQNFEFSTLLIPKELSEDANSVIRFKNVSIEMTSQRNMNFTIEKAITIYNKQADNFANIIVYFDKGTIVKSVSGTVYDGIGNEIEKIKKKDFEDYSASGGSLYSDNRVLYYDYTPTTYPYTIYYKYEIKTSNTAFIMPWFPMDSYYQSVQNSKYTFSFPDDVKIRKAEHNFEGFNIRSSSSQNRLTYEIHDFPAIEKEPYVPSFKYIVPNVRIGVNKFNLEGIDGKAENWEEFGRWYYYNLLQDTFDLSEVTKRKIKALTSTVDDPIEKAKIVYEFVQDKVRYISVQVGIGGFKPMLASEVDNLSYGDCKALTNYTKALLDAVDVPSNYTVIYGDSEKRDIENEFLSVQGNHVILNIPTDDGDLWLECTSQQVPFGNIAGFTDDRDALVITPQGGIIKHTRVYDDRENQQKIIGKYILDNDGHIEGEVEMVSTGNQFDTHLKYENSNNKDREKMYKEFWDNINNMTLRKIDMTNNKKEGKFEEFVAFTATNYGAKSGERMIFPVNAFNVWQSAPKRIRDRKLPVEVSRGFYDYDEVLITLPSDYAIEAISDNVLVENEYGTYEMTIDKIDENTLKYTRKILLNSGDYPKEKYTEYRNFFRKVVKGDKSKIVLIKK